MRGTPGLNISFDDLYSTDHQKPRKALSLHAFFSTQTLDVLIRCWKSCQSKIRRLKKGSLKMDHFFSSCLFFVLLGTHNENGVFNTLLGHFSHK